jgi:nucleoside-diphosphate-sugar epimerase
MRVVIVGASGNVGTSLIESLNREAAVTSILGLARRRPHWQPGKTEWAQVDVATDDLLPHFRDAAAVVHLAWLMQPTHDPVTTWRVNGVGSVRVFEAAARAGVPALVYASSVGAYSPGPKDRDRAVDETWPTHGWPTAAYTREKAYVERALDAFEREHPDVRVVRLRTGFIFKRESAEEQRRLFAGPLAPRFLARPGLVPFLPDVPGLRFQALHSDDAAEAYRLALLGSARGAFNIAAEPVLDVSRLAQLLGAKVVRAPAGPLRAAIAAAWHLRLVPASPYLVDAVLRLPLMDVTRARTELGWSPRHSAVDAVREFLAGFHAGSGLPTPPLEAHTGILPRARDTSGTSVGTEP